MRLGSTLFYSMAGLHRRRLRPVKWQEKTLDDRIEEGRKAPKWEPIPKFKHRQQKRGSK